MLADELTVRSFYTWLHDLEALKVLTVCNAGALCFTFSVLTSCKFSV